MVTKSALGIPGIRSRQESQGFCFWALFPGSRSQSQNFQTRLVALSQLTTSSTFVSLKYPGEFLGSHQDSLFPWQVK